MGVNDISIWNNSTASTPANGSAPLRIRLPLDMIFLLSFAYAIVFVLAIIGNSLVIYTVVRNPRMHIAINYFIVNLSVADMLMAICVLPMTLLSNIFSGWQFGDVLCKAIPYLQGMTVCASVNTLATIAIERYLAICHPLKSRITTHRSITFMFLIWLLAAVLLLPWAMFYESRPHKLYPGFQICRLHWAHQRVFFVGGIFIFSYLMPLILITLCYTRVAFVVLTRNIPGNDSICSGGLCNHSSSVFRRTKVKVVKMLVIVVIFFALSWLPLYVLHLLRLYSNIFSSDDQSTWIVDNVVFPLCQWLGASNSCVNPWIYCCFSHKYRRGFRAICCRLCLSKESLNLHGVEGSPYREMLVLRGVQIGSRETGYSRKRHSSRLAVQRRSYKNAEND